MRSEKPVRIGPVPARRQTKHFRDSDHAARLFDGRFQVGIGVYDGISALLAGKWQFDFAWVSSFCCSATAGLPDVGVIGPEDILRVVRCVRRLVDLPIVVDLDSGYGDAVKVFHVVEAMARAGAAGLCIEDNPTSKRCSLYDGYQRALAPIQEHVARLRAAQAAVAGAGVPCRIIARTEALVAGMGLEEALTRAQAYAENGADAVFIQSLDATGGEVLDFGRAWKGGTPLFIAPTRLPQVTRKDFADVGISHMIFANQGLRAAHAAIDRTFGTLAQAESAAAVSADISTVAAVADLVGARKVVELESLLASKLPGAAGPARVARPRVSPNVLPHLGVHPEDKPVISASPTRYRQRKLLPG